MYSKGEEKMFILQEPEDSLECGRWDTSVGMEGEATCKNRPNGDSSLTTTVSPVAIGKVPPVKIQPLVKDRDDLTNPKVLGILIHQHTQQPTDQELS